MTLDVDVQTLAFCELRRGLRLVAPPVDAIMIHYVLAGTMHMTIPGHEPLVCLPGSIVLIPPAMPLHVAGDGGPSSDVIAEEHCFISRDGVLFCDAADGGVGDLRYALTRLPLCHVPVNPDLVLRKSKNVSAEEARSKAKISELAYGPVVSWTIPFAR